MRFAAGLWLVSLLLFWVPRPKATEPTPSKLLLVPKFNFTIQDFQPFAQKYLEPVFLKEVQNQEAKFLRLLVLVVEQEREEPHLSLLVDKEHALLEDYVPDDLVTLKKYPSLSLTRSDLQLRKLLLSDLLKMNAAAVVDGVSLSLGSTYRSFAYQRDVFQRYVRRDGIDEANRYSARAGQSQHQLGLTVDFMPINQAFADTVAGKWLDRHALEYGFSLSYPEKMEMITGYIYEPWHYRYVGQPIAALISQYFGGMQQKFYLFWLVAAPELKRHYHSLEQGS